MYSLASSSISSHCTTVVGHDRFLRTNSCLLYTKFIIIRRLDPRPIWDVDAF